jgi:hypothetical protein
VVERFQEWQKTGEGRDRIHAWNRYVDARDGLEPGDAAKVFYESQISDEVILPDDLRL